MPKCVCENGCILLRCSWVCVQALIVHACGHMFCCFWMTINGRCTILLSYLLFGTSEQRQRVTTATNKHAGTTVHKLTTDTPINIGNIYYTNMCICGRYQCTQYMGHGLAGSDIYRGVRLHQCVHKQYTFLMVFRVTQYARNASVWCTIQASLGRKQKCERKGGSSSSLPSHPMKRKIYFVFTGVLAPIVYKFIERIYSMREYIVDQGIAAWCHCILRDGRHA